MIPKRNPDREVIIDPREFKFEPFKRLPEKHQFDQWAKQKLDDAGFVMDRTRTQVVAPFHREPLRDGRIWYRQWLPKCEPAAAPTTASVRIWPDALDRMEVDPAVRPGNRYHPELEAPMKAAGFRFAADGSLIGNIEAFYEADGAYNIIQEFPR